MECLGGNHAPEEGNESHPRGGFHVGSSLCLVTTSQDRPSTHVSLGATVGLGRSMSLPLLVSLGVGFRRVRPSLLGGVL